MRLPESTRSVGRYAAICAATTIVLVLCILFVDRPVADLVATHFHRARPVRLALMAETLVVPFAIAWILGCGILAALGHRLSRFSNLTVLASVSLCWAIVANYFLLQPFFGRIPITDYVTHRDAYGFVLMHGRNGIGFPSGHTVIAASFLLVFWHAYPRARVLIALAIAAVMLALMIVQWHFLSDIIAGLFVGAVAAMVTMRLFSPIARMSP